MILSSWGSPGIPSGQSESCMHIKVSRPVLFGIISSRPALSWPTRWGLRMGSLDLFHGASRVTFPLWHPPAVEGSQADPCPCAL